MASIAALRKQAKDAGASRNEILAATTAEELQELIEEHSGNSSKSRRVVAKKKATVAKKKSAARKQTRKASVSKKSSGRKSAPARSRKSGKAKRSATATRSNGYVAKGGRNMIEDVDFSITDGWNPRPGSPPDLIVKALKKARGNREKVFEALKGNVFDFVGRKNAKGEKRSKADAEAMLRYRISRTMFDFAIRTEQHEPSANRVQYGTGDTGQGIFKPAKRTGRKAATRTVNRKKSTARKTTAKKASRKGTTRRKSTSRR